MSFCLYHPAASWYLIVIHIQPFCVVSSTTPVDLSSHANVAYAKLPEGLGQSFSTFLMLRPFSTVPCCGDSNHKFFSLLLHNCNFATVMGCNVNVCVFGWSLAFFHPLEGIESHRLKTTGLSLCGSVMWSLRISAQI